MFGVSFGKLFLLIRVIAVVVLAWRWLDVARQTKLAEREAMRVGGGKRRRPKVVDMERNPDTGAYEPPSGKR